MDRTERRIGPRLAAAALVPIGLTAATGAVLPDGVPSARAEAFADEAAWRQFFDLLGFANGAHMRIEPRAVTTLFDGTHGPQLSDHAALLVEFGLSWDGAARAAAPPVPACRP